MSRKVYVTVRLHFDVNKPKNVKLDDVLGDMEWEFVSTTEGADIEVGDLNCEESDSDVSDCHVHVEVYLIINVDEGIDIEEVLKEMDYGFDPNTEGVIFEKEEIIDWEITDSK